MRQSHVDKRVRVLNPARKVNKPHSFTPRDFATASGLLIESGKGRITEDAKTNMITVSYAPLETLRLRGADSMGSKLRTGTSLPMRTPP